MKGRATISWGITADCDLLANVILDNGLEFSLETSLANTIIATQGKTITTELEFNPDRIMNGASYFTTMTGIAIFHRGTVITYKDDPYSDENTGHIILPGLDLKIATAVGDSVVRIQQHGKPAADFAEYQGRMAPFTAGMKSMQ